MSTDRDDHYYASGEGSDFFVPADDPRPAPPRPPARPPVRAAAAPPVTEPEPAFAGVAAEPARAASSGTGGLILPPGIRSVPVHDAPAPPPTPRAWAAPVEPALDDDYYAEIDDLDRDTGPPLPPGWPPAPRPGHYAEPPAWIAAPPIPPAPPAPPRRRMVPQRPQRAPREPRPDVDWAGNPVSSDLTSATVVRMRPIRPAGGWRRTLFDLSGGRWNPGLGAAASAKAQRRSRIQNPLRGCHRVAVLSVKGGVGKTMVAAMLGLTFAEIRGDRVLAIDANPDLGTLADRLTGDTEVGMQHLLDFLSDRPAFSISDIEHFVSATSRLHVLAGSQEPCHGAAFTDDEYQEAIEALSSCYNVMIVDTGTGLSHAALTGALATADGVVIVGEPTVDAASRASMTLDWLAGSGYAELAADAIVVMSQDRGSREIDQTVIREHFAPRCRAVIEVPADPHLAIGGRIHVARCQPETREAFEELAAAVADSFPAPGPRQPLGGRPQPEGH